MPREDLGIQIVCLGKDIAILLLNLHLHFLLFRLYILIWIPELKIIKQLCSVLELTNI